jgi:sec-independent protein translocase protein TatA
MPGFFCQESRKKPMNVFGIGLPEMALIMVVALLIFGPKKLPEVGRSLGKAIRGFQEASREFEGEFKREAENLEQVVKTLPSSESEKVAETNSENHATSSSQQG